MLPSLAAIFQNSFHAVLWVRNFIYLIVRKEAMTVKLFCPACAAFRKYGQTRLTRYVMGKIKKKKLQHTDDSPDEGKD